MSVRTRILNARGNDDGALVHPDGELATLKSPLPPFGGKQKMRVFRQFLTDDGTSSGSSDMQVSASTASPSEFFVGASQTKDRYITRLSFVIADQLAALNSFGTVSALTNGCQLEYSDEEGTVTIHEQLQTNWDFVRLCQGNPAFGDGAGAFRASNVSGNSEGYIPILDFRDTFGFEWGVRLVVGTNQKITFRVRDDTTGVDQFDCIAYGFERAE